MLARTGYATGPVQTALARAGIPHRVLGTLGLYERSEVRDALAYLTLLANPADAQAFRRAVGSPSRGVGTATANRVVALARDTHHGDLIAASAHANAIESIRSPAVASGSSGSATDSTAPAASCATAARSGTSSIAAVMLDGGLVAHHQHRRDNSPKPEERQDAERVLEDLRSLCRAAQAYEERHLDNPTLTGFLEHAAGLHAHEIAAGEQDRRITVSTIHRAKGTEAQLVVLLGCEERLLPSWRALAITGPRAARRGAPPVLRRLHARQGPAVPHPRRDARRPAHRRPLPVPRRSRTDRPTPGARRLNTNLARKEQPS